jgi:hypothetical protein
MYRALSTPAGTRAFGLVEIIDCCMQMELVSEVKSLLISGLPELPAATSDVFWSKWGNVFMLVQTLIAVLQRHNNTTLNHWAKGYVITFVQTVSTYIARHRLRRILDWARPQTRRRACKCVPCWKVEQFLLSPTQEKDHFSYAEKIRKHLEQSFLDPRDFAFNTENRGIPYTLVIRKTNNGSMHASEAWLKDVKDLQRQLVSMRNGYVFDLVGGDIYQIAGLDDALKGNTQKPLQPVSASTQNNNQAPPVRAGTKRKADVD